MKVVEKPKVEAKVVPAISKNSKPISKKEDKKVTRSEPKKEEQKVEEHKKKFEKPKADEKK